jgi:hypothetical protein
VAGITTTVDYAVAAAQAIKSIENSNLGNESPESRYRKMQAAFSAATPENVSSLAQEFLTSSRAYNASGAAYQSDYQAVMDRLTAQAGMTSATGIDQQINLLQEIKNALTRADSPLIAALSSGSLLPDAGISTIINVQKFARGGIASGPAIFGEAGPEAAVPLPDGRSIPVTFQGAADNRETVNELKTQNRLLTAQLKLLQSGLTALIEGQAQGNSSLKTVESGSTLAKRA